MSELQASFPGPLPYKESPTIGQPDCVVKRRHIPQPKEPLMQTTQSQDIIYGIYNNYNNDNMYSIYIDIANNNNNLNGQ